MKKFYSFIFLAGISTGLFSQITAGMISQYYFYGNANDMVGTNNGIVRGATLAPDRFGNANAAYCYNGVNNHINLGTSTTLKTTTMSISLWAKINSYSNTAVAYSNQPFITTRSRNTTGNYEAYFMGMYKPTSVLDAATTATSGTQNAILSTVTASIGVWNHLVYMFRSDSTWLYINGVFQQKVYKGFVSGYLAGDSVLLGYVGSGPSTYSRLNGCLDDIRIYNRLLTPTEITTLYTEPNNPAGINSYVNDQNWSVYPIPSNGFLSITISEISNSYHSIRIFNTLGALVYKNEKTITTENKIQLDLSNLQKGIYFIELAGNNNATLVKKICIE